MDTLTALAIASVNRDKKPMVFDWEKAARLIKERKARHASAGLSGDWDCTGRTIFRDWKPNGKRRHKCIGQDKWKNILCIF